MNILGIETSCDETSVALLRVDHTTVRIRKNIVSSQISIHAKYGGVVPEVAARMHVTETVSLLTRALGSEPLNSFDLIAVTRGPGLATALRVGIQSAQMIAWLSDKPIVGINHLEGHLASAWLLAINRRRWKFPILALLVSGGHTELVLMNDFCRYTVLGTTRDDAAGEAFDKTAKLLGLEYPGGPAISKLAATGNPHAFDIPRPMIKDPSLDMSFSGLKSHVRRLVEHGVPRGKRKKDLAASIESSICDVLVTKTLAALKRHSVYAVTIVGGVSANARLRRELTSAVRRNHPNVTMLTTPVKFSTDNAAMISAAGYWRFKHGHQSNWERLDAEPELDL